MPGPHGEISGADLHARRDRPVRRARLVPRRRLGDRRPRHRRPDGPQALCRGAGRRRVGRLPARTRAPGTRAAARTAGPRSSGSPTMPTSSAVDPSRLAVGGDSAGGNLAAVVAQRAAAAGGPRARVAGARLSGHRPDAEPPVHRRERRGLLPHREGHGVVHRRTTCRAAPTPATPRSRRCSPTDVSGVAPAVVVTAEFDPLRDEGEAYAAKLEAAGVSGRRVKRYDGMIHGFFSMGADHPGGRRGRRPGRRRAPPSAVGGRGLTAATGSRPAGSLTAGRARGRPGRRPSRRSRRRWPARGRASRRRAPTTIDGRRAAREADDEADEEQHDGEPEQAVADPLAELDRGGRCGPAVARTGSGGRRSVTATSLPHRAARPRSATTRSWPKVPPGERLVVVEQRRGRVRSRKRGAASGRRWGTSGSRGRRARRPPGTGRPRPAGGGGRPRSAGCRTPPRSTGTRPRRRRRRCRPSDRAAAGGSPGTGRRRARGPARRRSPPRPGRAASRCAPSASARRIAGRDVLAGDGPDRVATSSRSSSPTPSAARVAATIARRLVDVEAVVDAWSRSMPRSANWRRVRSLIVTWRQAGSSGGQLGHVGEAGPLPRRVVVVQDRRASP